jgi:vacuolar-type H+-ATPase subunit H
MNRLTLGEKDTYLLKIQTEIKNKKNMLVKKKTELENKAKTNKYLKEVKNDYNKYYDYIVNEKQQQYNALLLLKEYMDDLVKTENLVDNQIRTAKYDQKDILGEIDNVKQELDELMNQ